MTQTENLREHVRTRYAAAAAAVVSGSGASCCGATDALAAISDTDESNIFGAGLYRPDQTADLPEEAVLASLGCGNPLAVAEIRDGERVLDLGSGGGIDVLLSARRVGETGFAYGLDMTDEMLDLARANAAKAGATNVEFLKGHIEAIPLPDASIDVIISNCVINLSTDKPAVLAEMFRVLTPTGRIGISDVVAEDHLSPAERAERGSYVGCIAGALSRTEYLEGLAAVGFTDAQVEFTHEAAPGMHGAIVRATKPASCCAPTEQSTCCTPQEKATCCSGEHPAGSCACQPQTAAPVDAAPASSPTQPTPERTITMRTIEVFEPALCCNTGVCGDDVDQALVGFSADLNWANAQGGRVTRHNLANDPLAFAGNETVKAFLQLSGSAGLPLVLADGVTVLTGTYPTRDQLARWAGLAQSTAVGSSGTVGTATVPAGVQLLNIAAGDACCSTDSADGAGCC